MATRKHVDPPLATDDERAVFQTAVSALETAQMATDYTGMAHVPGVLQHALAMMEGMRGRHVTAMQANVAQHVRLSAAGMRDLTHRMIVHDERTLGGITDPQLRADMEANIEQRREWIRRLDRMEQAVQQ